MPKFDFKGQFSMSKIIIIFLILFSPKNFLLLTFFNNNNFYITLFSKIIPNFWHLPNTPILKIQQFPLGMLIFPILYPPLENFTTLITIPFSIIWYTSIIPWNSISITWNRNQPWSLSCVRFNYKPGYKPAMWSVINSIPLTGWNFSIQTGENISTNERT